VRFQVLGSLAVRAGDSSIEIGGPRQRTLLAALLVNAGRVVSVDALTDALWGDDPPADPRNAIQTHVARLRETLGDDAPLVTRAPGYVLEVGADQVDALRFERLLTEAQRHDDPVEIVDRLDEALGLWRGPAYAGFEDGVAHVEARRLNELRLVALEDRAAARIQMGEARRVIGELETLVTEHPLRERFVALFMTALAIDDRQGDALTAYRDYRDRLANETGLEPSTSLRDLETRVLRDEVGREDRKAPSAAGSSGSPLRRSSRRWGAAERRPPVPLPATSLVGREHEIAEIRDALATHRIVTLTGPGGVGKSRIAAQVASALYDETDGDATWVELASITEPGAVDHALAHALSVDLTGQLPSRATILDALEHRDLLLVLDNAEHLLEHVAELVDDLHHRCAGVRVLTTSRERLAVDVEQVLAIPPLPTVVSTDPGDRGASGSVARSPRGAPAAVQLFLDRAAAVTSDLDPTAQLDLVAAICRQLDGIPLAVELAAARTGALPLDVLLAALREDDATALGRRRSQPARHRDLWSVTDWSHRLLSEVQQRFFARLSVFVGPFDVDTAHRVAASDDQPRSTTIEHLAALTESSLLARVPGSDRYRMLWPLRSFARQRLADLGEAGDVSRRHMEVLVDLVERATAPPMTDRDHAWLELSLDDVREAHRHARSTGALGTTVRLVAALYWFAQWRASGELLGWATDLVGVDGIDTHPASPRVHAVAAVAAWMRGDLEDAREHVDHAQRLGSGPNDPELTLAFAAAGDVALFEGRLDRADEVFAEQTRLARLADDIDSEVLGLSGAALTLAYRGETAEAIVQADEAARAAVEAGIAARAFNRYVQGECRAEADPERAIVLLEEATELARSCDAAFIEDVAHLTSVSIRGRQGAPRDALPAFSELIEHWRHRGNWTQQWTTLRNLAELLVRSGADEQAVLIAAAADVASAAPPTFGVEYDRLSHALAAARERLGEDRFEAARTRGRRMDRHEVVDLAIEETRRPHGPALRVSGTGEAPG
jgi:predicted ATPase/DNA-binding SARP family transcriptional activator